MIRKSLAVAGAAGALILGTAGQAGASTDSISVTGGTTTPAATTATKTVCGPGRHYCTTFTYRSVVGGVILQRTHSVGFTTGAGSAREYLVVNGTHILPTNLVRYSRRNARLTATHVVNAKVVCGTVIQTDWVGRNAAQGAPGIRVICP
jgi:hypothetical protein